MSVLRAANVTAVPVRAVCKSSAWLLELFPECAAGKAARGYRCSLASNFLTQARIWQRMGRSGADADAYSLVIEDDIQRHSAVAPAAVRGLLDVAASASRQHGLPVFYAGMCGHVWYGPDVYAHEGWHAGLLFSRVHGSCAHAYAVRHGDAAAMAARARGAVALGAHRAGARHSRLLVRKATKGTQPGGECATCCSMWHADTSRCRTLRHVNLLRAPLTTRQKRPHCRFLRLFRHRRLGRHRHAILRKITKRDLDLDPAGPASQLRRSRPRPPARLYRRCRPRRLRSHHAPLSLLPLYGDLLLY